MMNIKHTPNGGIIMYGKGVEKEILYDLYVMQNLTIKQIAEKIGKSYNTTRGMIITYGIYKRSNRKSPNTAVYNITKEFLEREYTELGKTQKQIAKEVGCGETTIWTYLHEFGIPSHNTGHFLKGRPFSKEHREELSKVRIGRFTGEDNQNWRGGVSNHNTLVRRSNEYVRWRKKVIRDKGSVCSECGKNLKEACPCCGRKFDVHVHHVEEFSSNSEKRLTPENAIVLCDTCHRLIHKKQELSSNS